jgi:hypothetical protein
MSNRYLNEYERGDGRLWFFLPSSIPPEAQKRRNQLILRGDFDRKIVFRKPCDYKPERFLCLELECGHDPSIDLIEEKDNFDPSDPTYPCRACVMNFIEGRPEGTGAKPRGRKQGRSVKR